MSDFVYHKPRRTSLQTSDNAKIICKIGDVVLMCPECLHMIESNSMLWTKIIYGTNEIEEFRTYDNYLGRCPNCKEDVRFENIDINMAQIINILNQKGYYTAFCCEGHIECNEATCEEGFSNPYIYFYLWKDADILNNNPLPDTWYIDDTYRQCKIFNIEDRIMEKIPNSIIKGNEIIDEVAYIGWLKNHWDQRKRLEDIYNWAINLPDKDKNEKEIDYYYIRSRRDYILSNNEVILEYHRE